MTDTIRIPGKFEGEPQYIPAFWERALGGEADEEICDHGPGGDDEDDGGPLISLFLLDSADPPVLEGDAKPGDYLAVWERSDGFVCSNILTPAEYTALTTSASPWHRG